MTEFWEDAFQKRDKMWGDTPAPAALFARDYFIEHSVKNVLVPGFGYGRNAKVLIDAGITVTGIEISPTAIDIARKEFGSEITIHQGSVTDMPFDEKVYDGIFCYGLIHLLDSQARAKLIKDSFEQLVIGGYMIFTAVSNKSASFGEGIEISPNRFAQRSGAEIYFYDEKSIKEEFAAYGLLQIHEEVQPQGMGFLTVVCQKNG